MKSVSILLSALALIGCGGNSPTGQTIITSDTISSFPAGWVISYSPGMPVHPSGTNTTSFWYFDFPTSDGVHYVMVPYYAKKSHKTVTVTYRITGAGKFVSVETPPPPPDFRVILERQGDTLSASQEFYRWWSNPEHAVLIADGQIHTLTVPLTPDHWSSVFGKTGTQVPNDFSAALSNLMGVGITFGGGCCFGHGVYVSGGQARFEMVNFQIQ